MSRNRLIQVGPEAMRRAELKLIGFCKSWDKANEANAVWTRQVTGCQRAVPAITTEYKALFSATFHHSCCEMRFECACLWRTGLPSRRGHTFNLHPSIDQVESMSSSSIDQVESMSLQAYERHFELSFGRSTGFRPSPRREGDTPSTTVKFRPKFIER